MNNTFFRKTVPQGALLLFLYKVCILVVIDFIAILLTPGIFLMQIVNTNMYLIHFFSKNNIKMHFVKSWVLNFQNGFRHWLSIAMQWNKLHLYQQGLHNNETAPHLKKTLLIIIIYIVQHFDRFFDTNFLILFFKINENENWKSEVPCCRAYNSEQNIFFLLR